MTTWDRETDVLVFGSGAAGMTAALVAAHRGCEVLLCEKSEMLGGTTAVSGGTAWLPGNDLAARAGIGDTLDAARRYLEAEIGPDTRGLRAAFLHSAKDALDFLETHTDVHFRVVNPYPDYHPGIPGAVNAGRSLQPLPFDARCLGSDFARLRPPRPGFTILGGMMVNRDEAAFLVRPWRSRRAVAFTIRALLRHARERLHYPRGARLLIGNALAGRFFLSLRRKSVVILFGARLESLAASNGGVDGACVVVNGERKRVRARRGVVLATGGFAASADWRARLMPRTRATHVLADAAAGGDGLEAATRIGAAIDDAAAGKAFWMPASVLRRPGRPELVFPHVIMDRARPGLIAVDARGRRFVNEGDSYHDFVTAMFRVNAIPAYLVCDRRFVRRYGIGAIRPVWQRLRPYIDAGYLIRGDTLQELATRAGIDAEGLAATVARHNRDAIDGADTAFGKGSSPLNLMYGDPEVKPNPCLRPIETPPYFAVAVNPAIIGSSAGLATDTDARVLDTHDRPIDGLYACGNDQASIMRGHYPGAGITLGPAIVFGYRAGLHACGSR